ncbi:MAG: zinc-ribbon domain-containing protein [Deltaproteobacteria bacterium]|nr:zinc-ribbon domain-containing protein [Deltaproteobacteria bacterium]MBW2071199.1 zinc-ribbon domain-containing protein [Deltaproteobacteria bacterium]
MRIKCSNCQAVFHLADDKVPRGKAIRATCKKCNQLITVEPQPAGERGGNDALDAEVGLDERVAEVTDAPTAISMDLGMEGAYESPLEVLEEGAQSALVCVDDPERLKAVKSALKELKYHTSVASSVKEALSKLRYNYYDLVMLDERFCGEEPENNTILRYLQPMPMATRRRIFLVLISGDIRTLDNLTAFAKSVNAVVNVADLNKLKIVLERALAEHRRFYKVFLDTVEAFGTI